MSTTAPSIKAAVPRRWRIVYTNGTMHGVTFLTSGSENLARKEFLSMYPNAIIDIVLEDARPPIEHAGPVYFKR